MSDKSKGGDVWVVREGTGFVVKVAKGRRYVLRAATQRSAITYARSLAKAQGSELIVQGEDGRIRVKASFGNDPRRSKG
jgi:hypothetical protein